MLPGGWDWSRDWCLSPLVIKALSRDVWRGSCGFRRTSGHLSAVGRAVLPPCWFFGLRHPTTGTYRWDKVPVPQWWPPGEPPPMSIPWGLWPCVLAPQVSVSRPPLPQETFQRPPRVLWSHFFTLDPSAHESLHESFPESGAWHGVQNFLFCRRTSWYNYLAVCKLWFDYIMNLPPSHLIVSFSLSLELQYLFW